jgi:hypothetical protein
MGVCVADNGSLGQGPATRQPGLVSAAPLPPAATSVVRCLFSMLRNSAAGLEIGLPGRSLAGLLPGKHRYLPAGRFPCFPGSSPAKIRPGRPISGPEALLRNVEYSHFRSEPGHLTSGAWGGSPPTEGLGRTGNLFRKTFPQRLRLGPRADK